MGLVGLTLVNWILLVLDWFGFCLMFCGLGWVGCRLLQTCLLAFALILRFGLRII